MDSRIQEILASYGQQESEDEGEKRLRENPPPRSIEDFLAVDGHQDWPNTVDDFGDLTFSIESVGLGSLEEIKKDLSSYARILES
jgi:hypothetical protein